MKIVMLSDVETSGGAAISAGRLAAALIQAGHEVTRVVGWPQDGAHPWRTEVLKGPNSFPWRIARRALPETVFEKKFSTHLQKRLHRILQELKPDCINVHNLHSCFPQGWRADLVSVCSRHSPTIWTLHDMWSFTGRCAYSYDCEKFLTGCDHTCPTPDEYPALSPHKIHDAWQQRSRFFSAEHKLIAVTPSRWLATEARRGFWKDHCVKVIPYGVPLRRFRPLDRGAVRKRLGIAGEQPVLLFAAHRLSDKRKGTGIFLEALSYITSPVTVITFGESPPQIKKDRVRHVSLGYLEEEEMKVDAYNAADLFVNASLADNLPNVVIESIACGTPVVAFPTGGVPEIVRPGITGWLAQGQSAASLGRAMEAALEEAAGLRASCRRIAEQEYSDDLQALRYIELMKERI